FLPLAVRDTVSVTIGLKYAASRKCTLVFSDQAPPSLTSEERDRSVYSWNAPPAVRSSAHDAWLRYAQTCHSAGRSADVERLCLRLTQTHSAADLARIAAQNSVLAQPRMPT